MEESNQWQMFVQTGDIRYYLRYKENQALMMAGAHLPKEQIDGRACDVSAGITPSEV